MRIAFLALLFANLVLFAWSQWFAPESGAVRTVPAATAPSAAGAAAKVRILLASERPAGLAAATPGSSAQGAEASASGAADAAVGAADAAGGAGEAGAPASASAGEASAAGGSTGTLAGGGVAQALRCVSMGPFVGLEATAAATAMLKGDGYEPRQRPASGPVPDGYMVVIGQLRGEADQARIVRRLSRGGLDDAFALPQLADGYAVSVGLFSQRPRAERRVVAVERMGLKPAIVERTRPGTVYWIDFDLKTAPGDSSALDPLLKSADASQKWRVTPCPEPRSVG